MKLYRIESNIINGWLTENAYNYYVCLMSTGEYHTHKKRTVDVTDDLLNLSVKHPKKNFIDIMDNDLHLYLEDYDGVEAVSYWYKAGDCDIEIISEA